MLKDKELRQFFDDVDAKGQRGSMTSFLALALEMPRGFKDLQLRKAHSPVFRRGLRDEHVVTLIKYFMEAVREKELDEDVRDQIAMNLECAREEITREE